MAGLQGSDADYATVPDQQSTNVIDDALRRVRDLNPKLADTLQREIDALRQGRNFGLVFERHLPESVRLTDYPIKRGVRVARRHPAKGDADVTWRVLRTEGRGADRRAWLVRPGVGGEQAVQEPEPVAVRELIAIREFGEPVFPGLKRACDPIRRGEADAPNHVVINGENFHALQLLKMTHRAAIDLIYIDPPYNTGNKGWIYNDHYVAEQDGNKHAKWLSFMERRLTIARELLKGTGVIYVAIGDDEHHRLRMLMDQIFGAQNFLSDIVWHGGRKNDSRHVSNGADYMLVYAKRVDAWSVAGIPVKDSPDVSSLTSREIPQKGARWRVPRPAQQEMLAAGRRCWEESGHDPAEAMTLMKAWIKGLPIGHPARENNRFYEFETGTGRVFRKHDVSWPGGGGPRYEVLHPKTGLPVKVPGSGWRFGPQRMQEMIDEGQILFGPDHTHYVNRKLYLEDAETVVVESVFHQKRTSAATRLESVLGDKRFPNPKDHEVLMRWIRLSAPKDAVVLDFFGGSGTTAEAVIRLNTEDRGTRQAILVTNNELAASDAAKLTKQGFVPGDPEWEEKGVFEYVTRPRLSTVTSGTRPDGSRYSEGLAANIDFFNLTYLDPDRVSAAKEFSAIGPLLWLRAGAPATCINEEPEDGYEVTPHYAVLSDTDQSEAFVDALIAANVAPPHVFVVTDSTSEFDHIVRLLPDACRSTRLYESYLRNFTINHEVT